MPSTPVEEIPAILERARQAYKDSRDLPQGAWLLERLSLIGRLRALLVEEADSLVAIIGRSMGKPSVDALTGDVWTTVEAAHYYERHAARLLAPERRRNHLLSPGVSFEVEHVPYGVVAIFGPWNYPLQLSLIPALTALVAGNAVVLKPSERVPLVGQAIADLLERVGFPEGFVHVVQGGADVGQAILRERPDKVFFTGSSAVGRQILQAAAPDVTPVDLELGGKAPMIVFADAHLERAAAAAVWGAFVNAGQSCLHVERLYVEASAHDRLVTLIQTELSGLRVGTEPEADVGPVIGGFHAEHVEALVDDAIRQGARLGTERRHEGNLLAPLLLLGAHHGMRILREETFGPVLPVVAFPDGGEAEAIRLANDSSYGLNGYVFSSDLERARRVARALNVGNVGINDVIKNVANPDMPFGGVRGSGFGRYHGPEGLRAFTRPLALATHAGRRAREQNWFPTRPNTYSIVRSALSVFHGKRQRIRAAQRLVSALLSKTGDREKTGKP